MQCTEGTKQEPRLKGTHHVSKEGTQMEKLIRVMSPRHRFQVSPRTMFHSSSVFTTSTPHRRSECPPKYFVP